MVRFSKPAAPTPEWDPPASPLWRRLLLHPASVGMVTAAIMAAHPDILPTPQPSSLIHQGALSGVAGFAIGYGFARSVEWMRLQAIKQLFNYQGWVYNQKSTKTKAWAVLLKLLKGSGPHKTLEFQPLLPHLPLPDLNGSLDRWLGVCEQLLSPEEFELSRQAIEEFRVNEGPKLQQYLQKRYDEKVNWLSDYWMTVAYLSGRAPIAVNSNFYFNNVIPSRRTTNPLARATNKIYNTARYSELVLEQRLPPVELQSLVPLCMNNYRYLYNSCRLPGEHLDTIVTHPDEKHIVVIRRGYYFKVDMYHGDASGGQRLMTRPELYKVLQDIVKRADELPANPLPVAALTAQRRDTWAKHREMLMKNNKQLLHLVESALFVAVLDDHKPKDASEHASQSLTGAGYDRWFDKSFNVVVFDNCKLGVNVEHSVIDATVMSSLGEFCLVEETYDGSGNIPAGLDSPDPPRALPPAQLLTWDLANMEEVIKQAEAEYKKVRDDIEMISVSSKYGKDYMKKKRLSPDGYIQMAMQLAFYRLHKIVPKTYEPSTARMFALGRTETVHPISPHSTAWVKSMDDPSSSREDREKFLRAAIKHQTAFRLDATIGQGCDRHLLGLYCAARELGMDIPKVFMDKAFNLGYRLSTSQVPTQIYEWQLDVEYEECGGGFGAVTHDGYGICYIHLAEDLINLHISSWRSCPDTSSHKFEAAFHQAMADMKTVLG